MGGQERPHSRAVVGEPKVEGARMGRRRREKGFGLRVWGPLDGWRPRIF